MSNSYSAVELKSIQSGIVVVTAALEEFLCEDTFAKSLKSHLII